MAIELPGTADSLGMLSVDCNSCVVLMDFGMYKLLGGQVAFPFHVVASVEVLEMSYTTFSVVLLNQVQLVKTPAIPGHQGFTQLLQRKSFWELWVWQGVELPNACLNQLYCLAGLKDPVPI